MEERIFPLLVDAEAPATDLLGRALIEHQRLYALTGELEDELAECEVPVARMREVAEALDEHIRFEERTRFPLIEDVAPERALRRLQEAAAAPSTVELLSPEGKGPLWVPRRTISTRRSTLTLDGEDLPVGGGEAIVIENERTRRIAAEPESVRYLSVPVGRPSSGSRGHSPTSPESSPSRR